MNNAIFFYNLPYVYGGVTQPYFMSDTARDSWFNKYSATQVNGTGVSIKFGYNYELEVVVNVDYTQINNFNFAVIQYNNKKFYANIIDSELVSINKSRVYLIRNALFEVTNYLNYFTNFKISKSTIFDFENYTKKSSFFINEKIRYYYSKQYVSISDSQRRSCILRPCIFLYLDPTIPIDFLDKKYLRYSPYNASQNFIIAVLPLSISSSKLYIMDKSGGPGFAFSHSNISELLDKFLNKYSSYLIKYEVISIPCIKDYREDGDLFPYSCVPAYANFEGSDLLTLFIINDQEIPRFSIFFSNDSVFEKNYFYFFDRSNEIEVSAKEISKSGYIEFEYSLSSEISSVTCFIKANQESPISANSVFGEYEKIYTFQFNYDVPFIVTSESTFLSENRYYNALTTNAIAQKGTSGLIQSLSQFGAGASELSSPRMLSTDMTTGSLSLGLGNIIRGIASLADTSNDIYRFKRERNLLAQQEMESPRTGEKGGNFLAQYSQLTFAIEHIIMKPFESDLSNVVSEFEIYGGNCYVEENDFNFGLHTVNGYFYLSAIAVLKHPSTLTARQYSELYNILRDGCRYEIINN